MEEELGFRSWECPLSDGIDSQVDGGTHGSCSFRFPNNEAKKFVSAAIFSGFSAAHDWPSMSKVTAKSKSQFPCLSYLYADIQNGGITCYA